MIKNLFNYRQNAEDVRNYWNNILKMVKSNCLLNLTASEMTKCSIKILPLWRMNILAYLHQSWLKFVRICSHRAVKPLPLEGTIFHKSIPLEGTILHKSIPLEGTIFHKTKPLEGTIYTIPLKGTEYSSKVYP
jgi:hypothetical protein